MGNFSPKIEIINHFDSLINRVDVDIEECLRKYNEKQEIGDIQCPWYDRRAQIQGIYLNNFSHTGTNELLTYESYHKKQKVDLWSQSTKVVDYLNQVRTRTIEELRRAQEDYLEYYKANSSRINDQLAEAKNFDEMRSRLFRDKFYFQVLDRQSKPKSWFFNLYTIVTDFYLSQSDIDLLETLINDINDKYPLEKDTQSISIFDEKLILISYIKKCFFNNMKTENFPYHVIEVRKQDLLSIEEIASFLPVNRVNLTCSSIDLSRLERLILTGIFDVDEVKLENLSSLKCLEINFASINRTTLRNLFSLQQVRFYLTGAIRLMIHAKFSDNSHSIKKLILEDAFTNIEYLRTHLLSVRLNKDLKNFDFFKNICNQLEELTVSSDIIDNESIVKLFYANQFPNLMKLRISYSKITKLERKFLDRFPMLKLLSIYKNKELCKIDYDSFWALKHLNCLILSENGIESLDKRYFSELVNLEMLDLRKNRLESIEDNIFSNLTNLKTLYLSNNKLTKLNPKSFIGLDNVNYIDLRYNELKMCDLNVLENVDQIKTVQI